MNYIKSNKYNKNFLQENIMGPNPIKLLEEVLDKFPLKESQTILDLGCGKGVTSIFLAKEYGQKVFAADLWITPTENKQRFDSLGLSSDQIIPILAEAHALPFAEEFFDGVVSVDSYHYFGYDTEYLGKHLLPVVKHGGFLVIIMPGFKKDIHENLPEEIFLSWDAQAMETFHDIPHWKEVISQASEAEIEAIFELDGFQECWNDWLACENEYAIGDRASMNAGAGKHMNFIAIILKRK